MVLERIDYPKDLKSLNISELKTLAHEIRTLIIDTMSKNGGHLASNLGMIEISLALHYVFDTPIDKLIFDTSHQAYTHKIVTGRKKHFHTIRKYKGLSGFVSPNESPYDHFYAGHAGTGLSLSLGLAKSRDLRGQKEHVLTLLSDAPLSCGLTFEALNNISSSLGRFIIILNDNAMAISNGVGNLHTQILGRFTLPRQTRKEAKAFFQQFGVRYKEPVDGHDIGALIAAFEEAKDKEYPILIHALTVKGHGMTRAVEDPITYHGVSPFDPQSGQIHPTPPKSTFPKVFGKHLLKMADKDHSITAITPAMPRGSCLDAFMEKHPERCLDVGIAEGHAVTFAAGLAYGGHHKVVVSIYATFFQRALDNLFQDVCLQNLPIIFALDRAGLSPADGTTHHGIFDISFLYAMPDMIITQPRNGDLLKDLLESAFSWKRPVAIRYPNLACEETDRDQTYRPLAVGEILAEGEDIVLIALGPMYRTALEVRKILQQNGIQATVVDPIFLKPLDKALFLDLLETHTHFVTIEEHAVTSGLGMIINSFLTEHSKKAIKVQNFGLPDRFLEHGDYTSLIQEAGLSCEKIASEILLNFTREEITIPYEDRALS
ncbi:MAG: 1-deoxy-D-xylulose-5-phosphate synthase [Verrucomicrobia bacterium]|nr:1-deoxy-D-xylulose-5-phosphate synthase [Verrucomicrobiota bacterium]